MWVHQSDLCSCPHAATAGSDLLSSQPCSAELSLDPFIRICIFLHNNKSGKIQEKTFQIDAAEGGSDLFATTQASVAPFSTQ